MIPNMPSIYHIVIGCLAVLASCSVPGFCHVPINQPYFLSDPLQIEVYTNSTIFIPCVVRNLEKSSVRWWKDDLLMFDSADRSLISPPRFTILPHYLLLIDKVQPEDAGNYKCQIVQPPPRDPLDQDHTVKVRFEPKITTVPEEGIVEKRLGYRVEMGCLATGWPEPVITWKFKDKVIKSTDSRHKLIFTAEDPEQSGYYECEANNGVGKPVTAGIILKVIYNPDIYVEKTWVHATPGMRIELDCTTNAEPRPTVEWYFEQELLKFDTSRMTQRTIGNTHYLTIRNVLDSDFGMYTCRSVNLAGEARQTIQLTGLAYPAVFKKSRGVVSPDSYSLIWEVDSYSPIIEYKLLFKEANQNRDWLELIIPADANSPGPLHSKSYTLSGLKFSTVYQAQLKSRNRFGWSAPSDIIKFGINGTTEITESDITTVSALVTNSGSSYCLEILLGILITIIHTFPVNL